MATNCPPDADKPILPAVPTDESTINAPVGAQIPLLPVNPPSVAAGPPASDLTLDENPPNYAAFRPRQNPETFREFCGKIPTLRMINGITMTILTNHFAEAANIIDPVLRQYLWNPAKEQTKIIIDIQDNWDPLNIGRKPAIYLKRGEVDLPKVAIGDRVQGQRLDGSIEYFTMCVGSHLVKTYGSQGASSDSLAFEVATLLLRTSSWIRDTLGLVKYRPLKIQALERDDRDPEDAYFSGIPLEWAFDYRYTTKFSVPKINFIDINAFRG